MILFNSDYLEGGHPLIMEKLSQTNLEQTVGYGEDAYCEKARELIRREINNAEAEVQFLVGGTQANFTVIAAALRPHQGVIAPTSGHISVHETGAVEATGHKVLELPTKDGKLTKEQVQKVYDAHVVDEAFEHMVQPKMVYISHPTEFGTLYTKEELEGLYQVCQDCGLYLFVDGARLGYGLGSKDTQVTLEVLAKNCDVFYIGGTKVGALFGEAVVILSQELKKDFRYFIKQKGGMLAKGRLLGLQFLALFEDGLYYQLGKQAVELAMYLKEGLIQKGYSFYIDSPTNQQFVILKDEKIEALREKYGFSYQCRIDESQSAVRFCVSWATKQEQVEALLADL